VRIELSSDSPQNQSRMLQEASVVSGASDGLESEIAQLYELHATGLLRYARSKTGSEETAREGLQEAFLRYFIERSYGREITHPRAWLFEVLRNYLSDRISALSARREVPGDHMDHVADLRQDPHGMVEGLQIARDLAASLSERELKCLQLRTEGLSYGEISLVMHVRTGTVGALLARAHEKIRKYAAAGGGTETTMASAVFCLVQEREACTLG